VNRRTPQNRFLSKEVRDSGDKFISPNQRVSQAPIWLGEHFIQHGGYVKHLSEPSQPCFMRQLFCT
jgi:hypothetical protein